MQSEVGRTPLHYAAQHGHIEVVKHLIEKEADVNVVDKYGRTPLHDAANNGRIEVVKHLIKKEADVNVVDKYGRSPLHEGMFKKVCQTAFLIQLNFQSSRKENIKLRDS